MTAASFHFHSLIFLRAVGRGGLGQTLKEVRLALILSGLIIEMRVL